MHIFYKTSLFVGLLAAFSACRPGMADDQPVVITIKPEFKIEAYEQRDSSTGLATTGLWVESVDLYDCAGYSIRSEVRKIGQQIEIDLLDVQRPANCTGPSSPARQFIPMGQLPAGIYPFRLSLGKTIVNMGTLTVENDRFSLALSQPQGVEIQNYTAYHLPDALVWGYAAIPTEMANTAAQNFISDLKTITTDHGLSPGFYSYFTLSGTGEVFFHSSIKPAGPTVIFVRKLTAAPTNLKSLLQNYRAGGAQEPLTVRCFSSLGEF